MGVLEGGIGNSIIKCPMGVCTHMPNCSRTHAAIHDIVPPLPTKTDFSFCLRTLSLMAYLPTGASARKTELTFDT